MFQKLSLKCLLLKLNTFLPQIRSVNSLKTTELWALQPRIYVEVTVPGGPPVERLLKLMTGCHDSKPVALQF